MKHLMGMWGLLVATSAWGHGHVLDVHTAGGAVQSFELDQVRCLLFSGLGGSDTLAAPVAHLGLPSAGQVQLSWTTVPEALEYRVYEVDAATGSETLLLTTSDTSTLLTVPTSAVRVLRVRAAR